MSVEDYAFDVLLCFAVAMEQRHLSQIGKVIVYLLLGQLPKSWTHRPFDTLDTKQIIRWRTNDPCVTTLALAQPSQRSTALTNLNRLSVHLPLNRLL